MENEEKPRTFEYDVYMTFGQSKSVAGKPKSATAEEQFSKQRSLADKWRRLRYVLQSDGFYAMLDEYAKMKEK